MPKSPERDKNNDRESALSPCRMAVERAQDIQRLADGSLTREQIRRAMPDDLEPDDDDSNSQADWYKRQDPRQII